MKKVTKTPWQIKAVVAIDVIVSGIATGGLIINRNPLVWVAVLLAIGILWGIYFAVWYGLVKGKRWALVGKAILLALQVVEWPLGTTVVVAETLILISPEVRNHFGVLKRTVS